MPATAAWLASAEALLNRSIDASTQAGALARRLQGTSLQVDIEGVMRLRASAHYGRLALLSGDDSAADAAISGSVTALWQLFKGGANPQPDRLAAQVRGDAQIANLYRELFLLARPDLEEELSRWVGDVPARHLSRFAQRALQLARHARRTAGENIAEYLQEEGRDLVNKTELDEFLRGVDRVRETADRIEARLERLEARRSGAG
jgi:ubiquinone biosynthesis accessory factor UbiJ